MNGNSTARVVVEASGDGVVAHVGLHALGSFADRLRLGDSLSAAFPMRGERLPLHDRGKVLTQAMLMLAGGGEACSDIEHLRAQPELFGSVPSDSTLYRTFFEIDPATRDGPPPRPERVPAPWSRCGPVRGAGNTPACAGTTLVDVERRAPPGEHPRLRGDDMASALTRNVRAGGSRGP